MDRTLLKQRLKDEFYPNLYVWALDDARREAEADFLWLNTMHHVHISHYLEILRTFTHPQRVNLFVTLTKISYQKSGEFSQVGITPEEERLLRVYEERLNKYPQYMTDIHQAFYIRKDFFKVRLSVLLSLVITELNSVFGNAKIIEKDYLEYRMIIASNWHISTAIHLDSRSVEYTHLLSALPKDLTLSSEERYKQRLVFSNPISLPRWLGFKDGVWTFFNDEDPITAAKTIALASSHFLNALPNLLSSLSSPL